MNTVLPLGIILFASLFMAVHGLVNWNDPIREQLKRFASRRREPEVEQSPDSARQKLGRSFEQFTRRLSLPRSMQRRLRLADLNLKPSEFLLGVFAAVLLCGAVSWRALGPLGILLGVPAGLALPFGYVAMRRQERQRMIVLSLPDFIGALAAALRSGQSLLQGLEVTSRDMHGPLAQEIARLVAELRLGLSWEEASVHVLERAGVDDLKIFFTAVLIQRQVGGNLAQVLDQIQETIVERQRLLGEVRALTAQGRLSGLIIGLLPVGVALMIWLISPQLIAPLVATATGHLLLLGAAVMEGIGLLAIRRVIRVDA